MTSWRKRLGKGRYQSKGPWANALDRLIRERHGLTQKRIAELAVDGKDNPMRTSQVSKIASGTSDRFLMSFLVRIAAAITAHDRETNMLAPDVPLWEFFVTDEQAAVLRERATKTRGESPHEILLKEFAGFLQHKTATVVKSSPSQKRKGARPVRFRRASR